MYQIKEQSFSRHKVSALFHYFCPVKYFLKLAYDGSAFHGWQRQRNADSVQETIEKALSTILRKEISVVGCGRTDTGVHARMFFLDFVLDESPGDIDLVYKLNALLPPTIAIIDLHKVSDDAHARYSATSRTYEYQITRNKDPFLNDFAWYIQSDLDIDLMRKGAKKLIGEKDFRAFCKQADEKEHHMCKLTELEILDDRVITIRVTANRFLRNMVRAIVGTLVELGQSKISLSEIDDILEKRERSAAGVSAPAKALFLTNIVYPQSLFKHE